MNAYGMSPALVMASLEEEPRPECCAECENDFEWLDDQAPEEGSDVPVEVTCGKFCSTRCAANHAYAELTESQKRAARLYAFAIGLILSEDVREFVGLIDGKIPFRDLESAAGDCSKLLGEDDRPSFIMNRCDDAYTAVVNALKPVAKQEAA